MEDEKKQVSRLIHQILGEQLRIGIGIDFHSLYEGYPLVLAGITIPHDKGFHVKRSDGDPVAHALVDALLGTLGAGDITDWFSDQDDVSNARSVEYLSELHKKLLAPRNITIINVQVIILAEQPRLKPFFPQMQGEIAKQLEVDPQRVCIRGKTFEGKGIVGQQQGIEAHALVTLLQAK